MAEKIVYLIRHAESEENRKIAAGKRFGADIASWNLPSSSDCCTAMGLCNIPSLADCPVSENGVNQINSAGARLHKDDFVSFSGIQLVAHSPLQRARKTSLGMLGSMVRREGEGQEEARPENVNRVVELECLREKTSTEWFPGFDKAVAGRIAEFEAWLGQQPETCIAVVGHSQFFKRMLRTDYKFGNCEVWRIRYSMEATVASGPDAQEMEGANADGRNDSLSIDGRSPCWKDYAEQVYSLYHFTGSEECLSPPTRDKTR
eukprot:CAMPEP_0198204808 /NCGR_PEP_ID=MMETSP1445-20131203/8272_1 /TAXON_ID=36898 /ORGANISM="Pyramimonas sp., Strain CCMP2087" /LENGTH=260 /DNA_ID=CAMNT_0043876861 /DNA_START=270 /DNA_END=1048 /DNA_ORIENTATION=-